VIFSVRRYPGLTGGESGARCLRATRSGVSFDRFRRPRITLGRNPCRGLRVPPTRRIGIVPGFVLGAYDGGDVAIASAFPAVAAVYAGVSRRRIPLNQTSAKTDLIGVNETPCGFRNPPKMFRRSDRPVLASRFHPSHAHKMELAAKARSVSGDCIATAKVSAQAPNDNDPEVRTEPSNLGGNRANPPSTLRAKGSVTCRRGWRLAKSAVAIRDQSTQISRKCDAFPRNTHR
jgi:hypothetical protein